MKTSETSVDVAPASSLLRDIEILVIEIAQAERDLSALVTRARLDGASWKQVGAALGISAQAAHQRWSKLGPETHRRLQAEWVRKNDQKEN
ncbi:hypothetical protein TZ00_08725 [Agreia bicolorata]|uniref:Homeodomain-like domain-containing protein n=1 Tax=Agreia bicolorata TaxID=110935 RepID=A0ABR5CFU5_9MICO|nr:hypothetical protein TZ00_08725 [Agreia bicolorata]